MPTYDYRCDANGRTYEVRHPMSQSITDWRELCEAAGMDTQGIPDETPVRKVISMTGGVISSEALKNPESPPCMSGGPCCAGGSCGF